MNQIFALAVFLLAPPLIVYLCCKFPLLNKIGIVVICYALGIALGNCGLLPDSVGILQERLSEVTVVLALPLLLFSMDVKRWVRLAGKTIVSMILATVAIIIIAAAGYFFVKGTEPRAWELAGMAIGVYTGGTPNLAAIKTALGIEPTRFIIVHTYDTAISIVYIIFCITIAQRLFNRFLPAFVSANGTAGAVSTDLEDEDIHSFHGILTKQTIPPLLLALVLSGVIVGISVFLGSLVPEQYNTSMVILSITTLGIVFSFIEKVRNIKNSFQLGMVIIYTFCFVVASMAKFDMIININVQIMLFVIFSIFGSMMLHALLCKLFKVDTDTFIITSASAICSPPFVPVVASGLKNKEVILSGLTTGIIGYAIGNYLGISFAYLMKTFF